MPKGTKNKNVGHGHGLLATIEAQYLSALRFSRDQLDVRIKALEGTMGEAAKGERAKPTAKASTSSKSAAAARKPRNYDQLKSKINKPMTIREMLDALGMKEKQEGTLRQTMQNYPGLFKSDGKRPSTYTLDSSR